MSHLYPYSIHVSSDTLLRIGQLAADVAAGREISRDDTEKVYAQIIDQHVDLLQAEEKYRTLCCGVFKSVQSTAGDKPVSELMFERGMIDQYGVDVVEEHKHRVHRMAALELYIEFFTSLLK